MEEMFMKTKSKFPRSIFITLLMSIILGVLVITTVLAAESAPQAPAATPTMPPPIIEFPGIARTDTISDTESIIPDTSGAAGYAHYMQAVNKSIAIYRKDGTLIDMTDFNSFWGDATTGTVCDGGESGANHHGQPYLMYDHMAGRWVVVDVAYDSALIDQGPYYLCIAVSNSLLAPTTPGAYFNGGFWYYYALQVYHVNENFYPSMPKLGLWPDGYYLSIDLFDVDNNGTYWSPRGVKVYALDRVDLTTNEEGLNFAYKDFYLIEGRGYEHLVPSNLLGYPPPGGTPNYFAAIDTGKFYIWEFKMDWGDLDASTFGKISDPLEPNYELNTDIYDWPTGSIIPQGGVTQKVEVHGDRLMSPVQYRILDGVPSLWATHTVEDPYNQGRIGLRWYEVQLIEDIDPGFTQRGVYAPDDAYRWLGSLATDRVGNMALGFSHSSSTTFPAIKYAGRLRNDPLDVITHGDQVLSLLPPTQPYTGSQDDGNTYQWDGPWGRQSQMSIDPMDDCVFWYTNMYYEVTGMDWNTRIGWFSFPECRGGKTTRISLHTDNTQGNLNSGLDRQTYEMYQVGISATGRYVVFSSDATNLVDDDTNGKRDVFLRDRDTDEDGVFDEPGYVLTTRISKDYNGGETNGDSWEVSISYDGRYIAYSSDATDIVDPVTVGDNNGARDVFLYDTLTDTTEMVSMRDQSTTIEGNLTSDQPFVSFVPGDGLFVAFRSSATNLLTTADNNTSPDIFVRDVIADRTYRVSVATGGVEANDDSYAPTLSETGQFVAFGSIATNLDPADADAVRDIFVHDRVTGITRLVSVSSSGAKGNMNSYTPFISGNGNFVTFASAATNLDDDIADTNGFSDIFVTDLVVSPTVTTRVSVSFFGIESMGGNSYSPSISRDGRYISFASDAYNLDVTLPDTNGRRDIFLHDRQLALEGIYNVGLTTRISLAYDGTEPNSWSYAPMVAPYGRHVAYVSEASDLVLTDTNNHWDVFAYDSQQITPIFLSIPGNIPASLTDPPVPVSVPVVFSGESSNIDTTAFSIDFDEECLSFDPTDGNSDGIPDAVHFLINSNFVTTAVYNASDTDGEIDVSIYDQAYPRTPIPDGIILTIDLTVNATCGAPPGSTRSARVGFSNSPAPSFASHGFTVHGLALDGFVRILEGLLGDCNGDTVVNAGDLSALVLEFFDDDGNLPIDTPGSTFPGNPVGCNPNQSEYVDAGDLSCTVMIIFGFTSCTGVNSLDGLMMYLELGAPAATVPQLPETEGRP
jgi:hypothetical protein